MKHKLWVTSLTILSACTLMACSHTPLKRTQQLLLQKKVAAKSKSKQAVLRQRILLLQRKTLLVKKPSGLEMQIMVTSIFQVNGSSSRISMGQKLSNIQMAVAIILSP